MTEPRPTHHSDARTPRGSKPIALPVTPAMIPLQLKALVHWLIWQYEWRGGKWTKVPYRAVGRGRAKSTDPTTWSPFDAALHRWQSGECDGIGFALSRDLGISGIDIDHCRAPETGVIAPEASEMVQLLETYTEVSPSGTGLRALARGAKPDGRCKRGNYEMYEEGRYLTITGCHLADTPVTIEPRQQEIEAVHTRWLIGDSGKAFGASGTQASTVSPVCSSIHIEDDALLEKVLSAKNGAKVARLWSGDTSAYATEGNAGRSEADSALCFELAFWTQDAAQLDRLFRRSSLFRAKWDERHYGDGRTYGEVTIARALTQVRERWTPNYGQPHQPEDTATENDPWEGMRTLPIQPYRGLHLRRWASHG